MIFEGICFAPILQNRQSPSIGSPHRFVRQEAYRESANAERGLGVLAYFSDSRRSWIWLSSSRATVLTGTIVGPALRTRTVMFARAKTITVLARPKATSPGVFFSFFRSIAPDCMLLRTSSRASWAALTEPHTETSTERSSFV